MTGWLIAAVVLGPLGFVSTLLLILRVLADLGRTFGHDRDLVVRERGDDMRRFLRGP